ncbi:MAG: transposase [Ferruginibacter sp.]
MNNKSKYNPQIHHRRSVRLKGYDYSQAGLYFITICCQDRKCRFGKIENGEMILNELGTIAYNEWIKLVERFTSFELDVFQIMPNHMHGIILLNDVAGADTLAQLGQPQGLAPTDAVAQNDLITDDDIGTGASPAPTNATIGEIIGAYKSLVFNGCLKIYKSKNDLMGKLWQRNYYEHIIRNAKSYENISNYIINNPAKWAEDKFYNK